jgi:hypothetical protein
MAKNRTGNVWEIPFVVLVPYAGDTISLNYWAVDLAQVDEKVQRDLDEADDTGWWVLQASGNRLYRLRPQFIPGYEIRPAGGSGRWSIVSG